MTILTTACTHVSYVLGQFLGYTRFLDISFTDRRLPKAVVLLQVPGHSVAR